MADPYRQSVVEYEAGNLSDEIDNFKEDFESRIDRVIEAAMTTLKESLKEELESGLKPLRKKADSLGGSLPSTNSTH